MFSLQNKKAVVTGGGSGIGKAIAALFAKQGAEVHIVELTEESAQTAVEEIKANGGKVFSHACNVANQQEVGDIRKNWEYSYSGKQCRNCARRQSGYHS